MKTIAALLLFLMPAIAWCQSAPVNFGDCPTDMMYASASTEPGWKNDSIGLADYMNTFYDDTNLQKIENGIIVIGILIYADGKPCGFSFSNLTKTALDPQKIKALVNNMPDWIPATQNGKAVTYIKQQLFKIKNGKFQ